MAAPYPGPGVHVNIVDKLSPANPYYEQNQKPDSFSTHYSITTQYSVDNGVYGLRLAGAVSNNNLTVGPSGPGFPGSGGSGLGVGGTGGNPNMNPYSQNIGYATGQWSNQTQEIIRLYQPTSRITVAWAVEKIGSTPFIPSPIINAENGNQNIVLANSFISPINIELMGDGTSRTFKVVGQYDYICAIPIGPGDYPLAYAVPDWISYPLGQADQCIQGSDYVNDFAG